MSAHPLRLLAAALLMVAACLVGAAAVAAQSDETVVISDRLEPPLLEVPFGTTVTWRNDDDERHRVRSRQGPVEFDSGNLEPGESFSYTFLVAGEYPYLDERNDEDADYFGSIVVAPDPAAPTDASPPLEARVVIIDESYQPPVLEVAVGATVTWDNVDDDEHTVTSPGAFDSGVIPEGSSFSRTFETAGTLPIFCTIHPDMEGSITVTAAPGATSLPSPSAPPSAEPAMSPAPAPAASGEVAIVDFAFEPPAIEVETGTSVTWTNQDNAGHTVTATEGGFDSGTMTQGDTFTQTFEQVGTFEYFCAIHPFMEGSVTVVEPGSG